MPLFRQKPDPMSLTMALVEAHAYGDPGSVERARQDLAPVPTMDIIESLYRFGQLFSKANLTPDQTAAIANELDTTAEKPEMTAAIQNVGRAILIDRTKPALVSAVNTYCPPLLDSTSDQMRQMALALAAITGSVCRRLEVRLNWK